MHVFNRDELALNYKKILSQNNLKRDGIRFERDGKHIESIVQSTSGSTGPPLFIPRSINDISDIAQRIIARYQLSFNNMPKRMAMIGGISHIEAAKHLRIAGIEICTFDLPNVTKILEWQPDLITCYPSILRTLLSLCESNLAFLNAIKVGGEKLFPSDCERIFKYYPNMLIIEQYGSTELPALAFRNITINNFNYIGSRINVPFELQTNRFSFQWIEQEGWQPIIAQDNFDDLTLNLGGYYDTGDEAYWQSSQLIDIRRRLDIESKYWNEIHNLFINGFTNFQIDISRRVITSEKICSNKDYIFFDNSTFKIEVGPLRRISRSNKLPLIIQ